MRNLRERNTLTDYAALNRGVAASPAKQTTKRRTRNNSGASNAPSVALSEDILLQEVSQPIDSFSSFMTPFKMPGRASLQQQEVELVYEDELPERRSTFPFLYLETVLHGGESISLLWEKSLP